MAVTRNITVLYYHPTFEYDREARNKKDTKTDRFKEMTLGRRRGKKNNQHREAERRGQTETKTERERGGTKEEGSR